MEKVVIYTKCCQRQINKYMGVVGNALNVTIVSALEMIFFDTGVYVIFLLLTLEVNLRICLEENTFDLNFSSYSNV